MAALGSKLMMVVGPYGVVWPSGATPHPTLWTSSDGLDWERLPDSPAFAGVPGRWTDSVLGLATNGSGLIAVGMQSLFDGSQANAEAWTSPDGKTWTRASVDGATEATMNLVYPVRGGFVAIGTAGYSFHAGMQGGTAIWTSSDGKRWTRLPQRDVPGGVGISSVAYGAGRYIAVGEALPPGGSPIGPTVPVWTSTDGTHYTMLRSVGEPPADATVFDVIWTGSAFVATGDEWSVGAFIWRSTNGLRWQSIALPLSGPLRDAQVGGVAQTSAGLVAVGSASDPAEMTHGLVWAAPDGRTWQQLATPSALDDVDLQSVKVLRGRVFVEGQGGLAGTSLQWLLMPVAPEAVNTCRTSQLAITQVGGGYAAGTVGAYLRFTNVGDQPCKMQGWSTLVGVTSAGATTQARDVSGALSTPEVTVAPEVMLAPGASAYAAFEGGDNPVGVSPTCPPPYVTLRITTPGSPDSTTISAWNANFLPAFGGYLAACVGLGVTPVIPAADLPYLAASPTAPPSP